MYRCPHCKESFSERGTAFPFCSPRCRLADLSQWLDGSYAISTPLDELEDEVDVEEGQPEPRDEADPERN